MSTPSQPDSPIHNAVRSGDADLLRSAIVSAAYYVDVVCGDFTPLQLAVWRGEPDMVTILLDAGADPNKPQADGMLPLDRALDFGLDSIAASLRANGAVESAN